MKNQNKKLYTVSGIIFLGIIAIIFSNAPTNYVVAPVQQVETGALPEKSTVKEESGKKVAVESKEAAPEAKTEIQIEENQQNQDTARMVTGSLTTNISFAPGTIFYDALVKEKSLGKIDFLAKEYSGLGFFITDIGPLHGGGGKSLLYYVNGKEATVGVSTYMLKDGDVIEWKLE